MSNAVDVVATTVTRARSSTPGRGKTQRRTFALWALVLVPVASLALGWRWAQARERAGVVREEQLAMARVSEAVRAAVDESLEELRAREDAQPFYLYDHYYNPPDVLAITDPVAISPLAHAPADRRIRGYFVVDPTGEVRTPFDVPDEPASPEGDAVRQIVAGAAFAPLRNRATPPAAAIAARGSLDVPLTQSLNASNASLYRDISQAQAGDVASYRRVQERGRNQLVGLAQQGQAPAAQNVVDVPVPARTGSPSAVAHQLDAAEVTITKMTFERVGDELALVRVVSHRGASAVQGVVLDRAHLEGEWLGRVVARHAPPEQRPRIVRTDTTFASSACATRAPASRVLGEVSLCFPSAPVEARLATFDTRVRIETALLLLMVALIVLAVVAITRAARRAQELAAQKTEFVASVTHELRTPLTTIRMNAEMLRDGLVSEEKRPAFLSDMARESVRLSRLVSNVLEMARLEAGKRVISKVQLDVGETVRAIVQEHHAMLVERGVELTMDVPTAPSYAAVDRDALEHILLNLLDNSLKHGAPPVAVSVREEAGEIVLRVSDRGRGVPEADRERIFERFVRGTQQGAARVAGTGIGLALVRELAEAHGGSARAEMRDGGGLTVRVSLGRALPKADHDA